MKFVLTPEVGALIGLLVNAIILSVVTYLTPIVKQFIAAKVSEMAAALGEQRVLTLMLIARQVVQYAEQAGLKGIIENEADKKLDLAEKTFKELAERAGITGLKPEEWRSAIEAALREGVHKRLEPGIFSGVALPA